MRLLTSMWSEAMPRAKGDLDLRREVEALLDANADAGSFLQHPVLQRTTATFSEADRFGIITGPYHLLELIGGVFGKALYSRLFVHVPSSGWPTIRSKR